MPRFARIFAADTPIHCTQRGNDRQDVFGSNADRRVYLNLLGQHCRKHSVRILGYCLMTNHVHIIGVPQYQYSLSDALRDAHGRYALYFNTKSGRSGHVWQGRFGSAAMDTTYFLDALRYVELNPVRACMVEHPSDWQWSSAQAHLTGEDDSGLLDLSEWSRHYTPQRWREALQIGRYDEATNERIRRATERGRPLGGSDFLSKLESKLGRRMQPLPAGRPSKAQVSAR